MKKVWQVLILALTVFRGGSVLAQDPCPASSKLYCLIPNQLHITGAQASFFNAPLGTVLGQLPLATPASGFVYTFDRSKNVYTSASESFGPVLTERSETIGKGKLFVAVTYQRFGFSSVDGNDLKHIPIVLGFPTKNGLVYTTTQNRLDAKVDQFVGFATYGLTNKLDISVAVPLENVSLSFRTTGTQYSNPIIDFNLLRFNTATGIGDVVLAAKYNLWSTEHFGVAAGTELRLPSGDELNFLGSGTTGVKPYVALSRRGRIAPHANLGYQWNGDSVLARKCPATNCTATNTGSNQQLPTNFLYAFGVDVGATRRLTLAADFLGQRFFDAPQVSKPESIPIPGQGISAPSINIRGQQGSFNLDNFAVGAKVNPWGQLLITGNVLIKLDDGGLRSRGIPMAGLSYTF